MEVLDRDRETFKLMDLGFLHPRFFNDNHWAAIIANGSFHVIVDGDRGALSVGYCNRWVYHSLQQARRSLEAWDGENDPPGFLTAQRSSRVYTIWP